MSDLQMRDVSEAVLVPMTEEEMANWRHQQGKRIICYRDRYWEEMIPGFYQPVHWMARLSAEQATRPTPLSWGFRASLHEDDAARATGSIPVPLLSHLESYDLQNFSANRRRHVRKCHKLVKIVELTGSALLQEQGYEVFTSMAKRTGYWSAPSSKEGYLAHIKDYFTSGRRLVLAGLIGLKLGGYIDGYAVNETAYIYQVRIATEVLPTNIGSGLVYEFVQACRRAGNIREVVYGLDTPEDTALSFFKERVGFPVKHIPARVQMNPIIRKFIHWYRPYPYYRLTGEA